MQVQQYYQVMGVQRADLEKQFPKGDCLVMSLENLDRNTTAGSITEVSVPTAARLLVERSHRLATADEITAYKEAQIVTREQIRVANEESMARQVIQRLGGTAPIIQPAPGPITPPLAKK